MYYVQKFSQFELCTVHKPILALLRYGKSLPATDADRLQRWSCYLAEFCYTLKYIKGKINAGADRLTRLPIRLVA